jgi:hypothetical protein
MLSHLFYFIGDITWRIPLGFCYYIYQYSMNKSYHYDKISGAKLWKEPED